MKEAVIRMETAARPTTDRSASPRLLKGLLLAITLVALLATTVILCQQDIENPSYVYMILDETGMQIIDGRPDGDRTTGLLDIRADNSSRWVSVRVRSVISTSSRVGSKILSILASSRAPPIW